MTASRLALSLSLALATSAAFGQNLPQTPLQNTTLRAPWASDDDPMPVVARTAPRRREIAPTAPVRGERGGRVLLESLGGLGMGLGGALVFGLAGVFIGGTDSSSDALTYGVIGTGLGFIAGVPLGVMLAGASRGGDGGIGWTILGTFGGTSAAALLTYALSNVSSAAGSGSLVGLVDVSLIVGGAVLGYELSCTSDPQGPPHIASRIVPTLSLGQSYGAVGVGGVF